MFETYFLYCIFFFVMKWKYNYIVIPFITIAVVLIGQYFTGLGMDWYNTLVLHPLTPSGNVIGMVWTFIFILSTISALIFWNTSKHDKTFGIIVSLFIDNIILNVLWSYLFFVKHLMIWSIVEMIVLWLITLILAIALWYRNKIAALLLVPYLIWVIIATFFAYQTYILNLL